MFPPASPPPDSTENLRRHYRVTYPAAAAPRLRLSPELQLVVTDLSESGVGVALTPTPPPVGTVVDAVLHFPGRAHQDRLVRGTVVHAKMGRWAVELDPPLAAGVLISEQGYLLALRDQRTEWPPIEPPTPLPEATRAMGANPAASGRRSLRPTPLGGMPSVPAPTAE